MKKFSKDPEVKLDAEKGIIEISGNSIPDNTRSFYEGVIKWIDNYLKNPKDTTTLIFKVEYMNSSSKKYLLDLIEKVAPFHKKNTQVNVIWFYEEDNDEMLDVGKVYEEITKVPFEYKILIEE